MGKKRETYAQLRDRMRLLEIEKQLALQEREDLLLQIASQSDPAWIELVLMKGLGLVPKGYKKVYFKREDSADP
jgi:hypothetical protein